MQKTPRAKVALSLFPLVALSFLASCNISWQQPKVWIEETREFEFSAERVKGVELRTQNGEILSQGQSGLQKAKLIAKIRAGGQSKEDAKACLDAIDLVAEVRGNTLVAYYDFDRKSGWGAQVNFTSRQPKTATAKLRVHNGTILATGVEAKLSASTHNGRINLSDCKGKWDLQTHSGGISAKGQSVEFRATSHNGSIALGVSSEGKLEGYVQTHNGSIRVGLGRKQSAVVEASTYNGSIRCDAPVHETSVQERRFRGMIGNGEGSLRLISHNGDIRIYSGDSN